VVDGKRNAATRLGSRSATSGAGPPATVDSPHPNPLPVLLSMDAIALSDDDDDFAPASQLSQSSLLEGLDRRLQEWCALASQPSSTSSRKRKWSTADDDDQPAARTDRAQKVLDKKADAARKKEEKQRLKLRGLPKQQRRRKRNLPTRSTNS